MTIIELNALNSRQVADLMVLMEELDPTIKVTEEMLERAAESADTHLFALTEEDGRIVGCASLCVFDSPTGRKASIEDVVVLSSCRGRHLGRMLMEHLIDYARERLGNVDLHLTSRPQREAANALYRSLGFELRETNSYAMKIRCQPCRRLGGTT